jgi:hypothetical protein
MANRKFFNGISPIVVLAILFSSCGNIDIVKRKHLPGFHVEMSKKEQRKKPSAAAESSIVELVVIDSKTPRLEQAVVQPVVLTAEVEVSSADLNPDPSVKRPRSIDRVSEFVVAPFKELKKEKLTGELRRAVFNNDDEKYGWSVLSMVSTGTSVAAFAMVILGLVFLASLIGGGVFLYWWAFALVGMLLGIGGMVMGIIGLRQTGRGEKRGRGFALAGMIGGIVSLAAGLITLFWGLIYTLISNRNEDF